MNVIKYLMAKVATSTVAGVVKIARDFSDLTDLVKVPDVLFLKKYTRLKVPDLETLLNSEGYESGDVVVVERRDLITSQPITYIASDVKKVNSLLGNGVYWNLYNDYSDIATDYTRRNSNLVVGTNYSEASSLFEFSLEEVDILRVVSVGAYYSETDSVINYKEESYESSKF